MKNTAGAVERRYNYSASFASQPGGVGGGAWLSLDEIRSAVAHAIRDTRLDASSVRVFVQAKKSRWLPERHGSVAEVFPDIWYAWVADKAVADYLAQHSLQLGEKATAERAVYRAEIEYEIRTHGLSDAIARATRKVKEAQAVLEILTAIEAIRARVVTPSRKGAKETHAST